MNSTHLNQMFDVAHRRREMAKKLGCRPEITALYQAVIDANQAIYQTQKYYREARQAKKEI